MNIKKNFFRLFVAFIIFLQPTNLILRGHADRWLTAVGSKNVGFPLSAASNSLDLSVGSENAVNASLFLDFEVEEPLFLTAQHSGAPVHWQEDLSRRALGKRHLKAFHRQHLRSSRIAVFNSSTLTATFPILLLNNNSFLGAEAVAPPMRGSVPGSNRGYNLPEPLSFAIAPMTRRTAAPLLLEAAEMAVTTPAAARNAIRPLPLAGAQQDAGVEAIAPAMGNVVEADTVHGFAETLPYAGDAPLILPAETVEARAEEEAPVVAPVEAAEVIAEEVIPHETTEEDAVVAMAGPAIGDVVESNLIRELPEMLPCAGETPVIFPVETVEARAEEKALVVSPVEAAGVIAEEVIPHETTEEDAAVALAGPAIGDVVESNLIRELPEMLPCAGETPVALPVETVEARAEEEAPVVAPAEAAGVIAEEVIPHETTEKGPTVEAVALTRVDVIEADAVHELSEEAHTVGGEAPVVLPAEKVEARTEEEAPVVAPAEAAEVIAEEVISHETTEKGRTVEAIAPARADAVETAPIITLPDAHALETLAPVARDDGVGLFMDGPRIGVVPAVDVGPVVRRSVAPHPNEPLREEDYSAAATQELIAAMKGSGPELVESRETLHAETIAAPVTAESATAVVTDPIIVLASPVAPMARQTQPEPLPAAQIRAHEARLLIADEPATTALTEVEKNPSAPLGAVRARPVAIEQAIICEATRDELSVAALVPAAVEVSMGPVILREADAKTVPPLCKVEEEELCKAEEEEKTAEELSPFEALVDGLNISLPTTVSMANATVIPANLLHIAPSILALPTVVAPVAALFEPFAITAQAQPVPNQNVGKAKVLTAGPLGAVVTDAPVFPAVDLEALSEEIDSSEIDEDAIRQTFSADSTDEAAHQQKAKKRHEGPEFYGLDLGPLMILKAFVHSTLPNIHEMITRLQQKQSNICLEHQAEVERLAVFLCQSQQEIAHLENKLKVKKDRGRYFLKKKEKKRTKIEQLNVKISEDIQAGINTLVRKVRSKWAEATKTLKAQLHTLANRYRARSNDYEQLHHKIAKVEHYLAPDYKQDLLQAEETCNGNLASVKENIAQLRRTLATELIKKIKRSYHKANKPVYEDEEDKENRRPQHNQPVHAQTRISNALKKPGFTFPQFSKSKTSIHNTVDRFLERVTTLAVSNQKEAQEEMHALGHQLQVDHKVYILFDELLLEQAEYHKMQTAHNKILKEITLFNRETAVNKRKLESLHSKKMAIENEIQQIDHLCHDVKEQYKSCKGTAKYLQNLEVTLDTFGTFVPYCTKNQPLLNLQKEIEKVTAKLKKSQDFLQFVAGKQENLSRKKSNIEERLNNKKQKRETFKRQSEEKQEELSAKLEQVQQTLWHFAYVRKKLKDLNVRIAELEKESTVNIPAPQYDARANIFFTSVAELEMGFAEAAELGFLLPIYQEWKQKLEASRELMGQQAKADREELDTDNQRSRINIEFIQRKLQALDLFNDF
jgi:hypothetical protein